MLGPGSVESSSTPQASLSVLLAAMPRNRVGAEPLGGRGVPFARGAVDDPRVRGIKLNVLTLFDAGTARTFKRKSLRFNIPTIAPLPNMINAIDAPIDPSLEEVDNGGGPLKDLAKPGLMPGERTSA